MDNLSRFIETPETIRQAEEGAAETRRNLGIVDSHYCQKCSYEHKPAIDGQPCPRCGNTL